MDGVVLGGGVGISAHGSVRVVTERTTVGMPEVSIGFTPDVGGSWLLARAPGELGTHLALTGLPVSGADAIALGLADHFVPSDRLPALLESPEIGALAVEPPASTLLRSRGWIDECYASNDAAEIVAALQASGVPEAADAASTILTRSPTSVAVTLESLRRARALDSLEQALDQEYRVALRLLAGPDLVEGIRAQVIDKDRTPHWSPATLAEVDRATVESHFTNLGEGELGLAQ
jgi:enoyl-CoA hydratase